jgi:hypothetical protein
MASPLVLDLCKIPDSVNVPQLTEYIKGYLTPRLSYYCEKKRAMFIEDEFSEFYTAKSTNGIEIGGGSCAMDVKTEKNEGIDALCVVMDKNGSNEKSLIQNFSKSGEELDTLFKNRKDNEVVELFRSDYFNKLQDVKNKKNLNDLYFLAFISTLTDVYIACFKINTDAIKSISSGGFVVNPKDTPKNIIVNNFINPSYGNVKIYCSKKRMELRLSANIIKNEHVIKIYTIPQQAME